MAASCQLLCTFRADVSFVHTSRSKWNGPLLTACSLWKKNLFGPPGKDGLAKIFARNRRPALTCRATWGGLKGVNLYSRERQQHIRNTQADVR